MLENFLSENPTVSFSFLFSSQSFVLSCSPVINMHPVPGSRKAGYWELGTSTPSVIPSEQKYCNPENVKLFFHKLIIFGVS